MRVAEEEETFVRENKLGIRALLPASSFLQPCTPSCVPLSISALAPFSCGRNRTYSSDQHAPEDCWFRFTYCSPAEMARLPRHGSHAYSIMMDMFNIYGSRQEHGRLLTMCSTCVYYVYGLCVSAGSWMHHRAMAFFFTVLQREG